MNPNDLSSNNPLFPLPPGLPTDDTASPQPPAPGQSAAPSPAVDLIRHKIDALYNHEPNARQEIAEAQAAGVHRSKHQKYMYHLGTSGKSLAEIQTAWHEYYAQLPDDQKHEVWQEFYSQYGNKTAKHTEQHRPTSQPLVLPQAESPKLSPPRRNQDKRTASDVKQRLLSKIGTRSKQQPSHFKSMFFGLAMGGTVVLVLLFSFFNERFVAPFVSPSRTVSNSAIITDPNSLATGPEPKIIIPKINVEIPVVYDEPSIDEGAVENALERGVVHYATTPNPGEIGNGVIFGHSSNNILNKGKYKFAFVLLKRMEVNDTFIIQKDGKRYVYRVFDKKIVPPSDVSVLGGAGRPATFTLITCDPPGTSLNRLIVVGEQISPDPASNIASKIDPAQAAKPTQLPSNSPSLWHRIWSWLD